MTYLMFVQKLYLINFTLLGFGDFGFILAFVIWYCNLIDWQWGNICYICMCVICTLLVVIWRWLIWNFPAWVPAPEFFTLYISVLIGFFLFYLIQWLHFDFSSSYALADKKLLLYISIPTESCPLDHGQILSCSKKIYKWNLFR